MYPYFPNTPYLNQQTQNIQYVNGKQSAESYVLPANSSVILMDSNKARFYRLICWLYIIICTRSRLRNQWK